LWDMQQRKTAVAMGDGIQMGHGCLSRVRQVPGGRYLSFTVAVPPDDGSFVSAAPEQSCRLEAHLVDLRDPHSNPVVLRDPDPCLQGEGAFYSPDGRCAVVTMWNGMARIWDLTEQPKPVGLLRNLGTGPCAFSDDGRFFMTLANSTEAKTSRIWDLKEFLSYF